jgi:hypothetical protein
MKIKSTIEVEHEITLPAYYKSAAFHFKIYSKENCIAVAYDGIEIKRAGIPFILDVTECKEEEFLTAYNKTLTTLSKLI